VGAEQAYGAWIEADAWKIIALQPRAIVRCLGCRASTWVVRMADTL